MNSFNTLLLSRRSRRTFLPAPVEKEKIDELVEAALASPTGRNLEPWTFVVVRDRDAIGELSRVKPHGAAFAAGAPLVIAVAADTEKTDVWVEDASIASICIQLAAEALGLGSCWVQLRLRTNEKGESSSRRAAGLLGLPGKFEVLSLIALGYSDEARAPRRPEELSRERVHDGRYGTPYSS